MLILLVFKNRDEQFVALFFDTVAPTLSVLEEFRENSVGIAEGGAVGDHTLAAILAVEVNFVHQVIELLEQLKFQKELSVVVISGQIEVERSDQRDEEMASPELLHV